MQADILSTELVEVEIIDPDLAPEGVHQEMWDRFRNEQQAKEDEVLWTLHRAQLGLNFGLRTGSEGMDKYLHGTQKALYYLIGADSSVGKTTYADFVYVHNLWEDCKRKGRPMTMLYCSFEISKRAKKFRWMSYYIFKKYGLRLPADYLMGQIEGHIPDPEHLRMALEAYGVINEMLKDIKIMDIPWHPTGLFNMAIEWMEQFGIVERYPLDENDKKHSKGKVKGFRENNPDMMYFFYVDHIALSAGEAGLETKGIMDRLSQYFIVLRNIFYMTIIAVQQFSTDMMGSYRTMVGKKDVNITPTRLDFGDSKATFRDADVVIGGVKPSMHGLQEFFSYDVNSFTGLGDYFVAWYIMKNRGGRAGRMIPMFIDGVSGYLYDLPLASNLLAMQEWIDKAQEIETICSQFSPKHD